MKHEVCYFLKESIDYVQNIGNIGGALCPPRHYRRQDIYSARSQWRILKVLKALNYKGLCVSIFRIIDRAEYTSSEQGGFASANRHAKRSI